MIWHCSLCMWKCMCLGFILKMLFSVHLIQLGVRYISFLKDTVSVASYNFLVAIQKYVQYSITAGEFRVKSAWHSLFWRSKRKIFRPQSFLVIAFKQKCITAQSVWHSSLWRLRYTSHTLLKEKTLPLHSFVCSPVCKLLHVF
jgi:hypothetical protein